MRRILSLFLLLPLLCGTGAAAAGVSVQDAAKTIQPSPPVAATAAAEPLRNGDVLEMSTSRKLAPEIVIAKIKSSANVFDTSPAALEQLKTAGVPDAVILALVMAAPRGARGAAGGATSGAAAAESPSPKSVELKIPAGIVVDVEAAYDVSSQQVREGEAISFRVVNPVLVDGVVVVAAGTTATGRVTKAARGGHFGRAGLLVWSMQDVTAVDGSRVPLEFATRQRGDSKGAKVATQTILVGAMLGPFAPLSLLHGFKRGENALIPAGKRFGVFVQRETTVRVAASK